MEEIDASSLRRYVAGFRGHELFRRELVSMVASICHSFASCLTWGPGLNWANSLACSRCLPRCTWPCSSRGPWHHQWIRSPT